MSRPDLPQPLAVAGLNAQWLSAALGLRYPGVEVIRCQVVDINPGTTTKVRMRLDYNAAGQRAELPRQVIVKGGFEAHSQAMAAAYQTENRFYAAVQPHIEMRSPACYYAAIDPGSWQGIVIMEDLVVRGVQFCHPLHPHSYAQVAERLRAMAVYHGQTWASPEFAQGGRFAAVDGAFDEGVMRYIDHYLAPAQWQRLLALPRGAAVSRVFHDAALIRRLLLQLKEFCEHEPCSIVHGDTHLGNLYVDFDGAPGFFDPQVRRAPWHYDVCYHLVAALDSADRQRWERDLLALYLDELGRQGVPAPGFDEAWLALRREVVWGLFIFLVNEPMFQTESANTAYAARFARAAEDWAVLDLV